MEGPQQYHTLGEALSPHAALSTSDCISLRKVRITRGGRPSGFDDFEILRGIQDGIEGFEVFASATIKANQLSANMLQAKRMRVRDTRTASVTVPIRFALIDAAYVVDRYMKKNEDIMILNGNISGESQNAGGDSQWRYFTLERPIHNLERETYFNSRLTWHRYSAFRFIRRAAGGYGLYETRPKAERTIEWLVDAYFEMYGKTCNGAPDGPPLHRADVRSVLAEHALWLRPRISQFIMQEIWDHWCDDEIPRIRAAAERRGIIWGYMKALPNDPEGRTWIKEDPDDETTTMRADERLKLAKHAAMRERGRGERERDRSPARRRRMSRSQPRSRRSKSQARGKSRQSARAASHRSPSLGHDMDSDDEVEILRSPDPEPTAEPPRAPESPPSPNERAEEPWEVKLLAEFPFLEQQPTIPISRIWPCPFDKCRYQINMYEPRENAEHMLLQNKLWDEFDPQNHRVPQTHGHRRSPRHANQDRFNKFMDEHKASLDTANEAERERLFDALVYMHWARDLFYMGRMEASKFFFGASRERFDGTSSVAEKGKDDGTFRSIEQSVSNVSPLLLA